MTHMSVGEFFPAPMPNWMQAVSTPPPSVDAPAHILSSDVKSFGLNL